MADTAGGGAQRSGPAAVELRRQGPTRPPRTAVVVGFDRSEASLAALDKAAELGDQLGAELHVVHAVDLSDYPVDPDAGNWEDVAARNVEEEAERVAARLADYPYGWSYVAVRSEPTEGLDRIAADVRAVMIVVGVRAHGWGRLLERLASPSVSHRLVNHGRLPVLVVPHHHDGPGA